MRRSRRQGGETRTQRGRRMKMNSSGTSALVTGGSRGIGRAIVARLARAGAAVAVNYHATEPTDLVEAIAADGGRALAVQADVSDKAEVEGMVGAVVEAFGGLDILVNNAGICPFHEFLTMPEELWDRVQDVNLKGAFLCSQAAANQMIAQGRGGRIIS